MVFRARLLAWFGNDTGEPLLANTGCDRAPPSARGDGGGDDRGQGADLRGCGELEAEGDRSECRGARRRTYTAASDAEDAKHLGVGRHKNGGSAPEERGTRGAELVERARNRVLGASRNEHDAEQGKKCR